MEFYPGMRYAMFCWLTETVHLSYSTAWSHRMLMRQVHEPLDERLAENPVSKAHLKENNCLTHTFSRCQFIEDVRIETLVWSSAESQQSLQLHPNFGLFARLFQHIIFVRIILLSFKKGYAQPEPNNRQNAVQSWNCMIDCRIRSQRVLQMSTYSYTIKGSRTCLWLSHFHPSCYACQVIKFTYFSRLLYASPIVLQSTCFQFDVFGQTIKTSTKIAVSGCSTWLMHCIRRILAYRWVRRWKYSRNQTSEENCGAANTHMASHKRRNCFTM